MELIWMMPLAWGFAFLLHQASGKQKVYSKRIIEQRWAVILSLFIVALMVSIGMQFYSWLISLLISLAFIMFTLPVWVLWVSHSAAMKFNGLAVCTAMCVLIQALTYFPNING